MCASMCVSVFGDDNNMIIRITNSLSYMINFETFLLIHKIKMNAFCITS